MEIRIDNAITAKQAAFWLGIKESDVIELIQGGVLNGYRHEFEKELVWVLNVNEVSSYAATIK